MLVNMKTHWPVTFSDNLSMPVIPAVQVVLFTDLDLTISISEFFLIVIVNPNFFHSCCANTLYFFGSCNCWYICTFFLIFVLFSCIFFVTLCSSFAAFPIVVFIIYFLMFLSPLGNLLLKLLITAIAFVFTFCHPFQYLQFYMRLSKFSLTLIDV